MSCNQRPTLSDSVGHSYSCIGRHFVNIAIAGPRWQAKNDGRVLRFWPRARSGRYPELHKLIESDVDRSMTMAPRSEIAPSIAFYRPQAAFFAGKCDGKFGIP